MPRLLLEDRFTTHKKIHFLLYIGTPFIYIFVQLSLMLNELSIIGYLIWIFSVLGYGFIFMLAFLKRGFIKIESALYRGSFFYGKLIFKKKIELSKTPKVSILSFNKVQNLAWFSAAKPNLSNSSNVFEINILNTKHTERKPILNLLKRENAEKAIEFLTSNFELQNETYSPDFT